MAIKEKFRTLSLSFLLTLLLATQVAGQNFDSPAYKKYLAGVEQKLTKHWIPPLETGSRNTVVVFMLHEGGELTHLRMDNSCGLAKNDQSVLKAVENGAPYPPSPSKKPLHFRYEFHPAGIKLLKVEEVVEKPYVRERFKERQAGKIGPEPKVAFPDGKVPALAVPQNIIDTTRVDEMRKKAREWILPPVQ